MGYELDVNFNGHVADGGISRGIFLTGGGATGNNTSSVALDIQHAAYDGSWLPWSTGLSIREALNHIQMYKSSANEAGFFLQAFDQSGNVLASLDKNGHLNVAGLIVAGGAGNVQTGSITINDHSTPTAQAPCVQGTIHADDNYLYACTSAGAYKRVALTALQ